MAFVTDVHCSICEKTKNEVTDRSGVCQECRQKRADTARRMHLAGLKVLDVTDRLECIEAALYDLNAERRLRGLESRLATYA